jgi:hypothetical protein
MGPTPRNDVLSPEILEKELNQLRKKATAVIEKIWVVLQLPVLELSILRNLGNTCI